MEENKMIQSMQTQIKLLLMVTGDKISEGMLEQAFDDDADFPKLEYQWKEFYDDIMEGGVDGFSKHYDVSAVTTSKSEGPIMGAMQLKPLNPLSLAVMVGVQSLREQMADELGTTGGLEIISNPVRDTKPVVEEGYVTLTPERCREIEFNVGDYDGKE